MNTSTDLQLLSNFSPVNSLDAYIHRVNNIPFLTQDEEQALANRYTAKEDLAAARQLVMSHLRYVVRVARGYMGYGLPLSDLIQEGNIGLMKAVKRFNPDFGVRLVSFAVHWIKSEIHEFIIRNWRIVKVATTKAQRKLFFNLRKMKQKLGRLGWCTPEEVEGVANDLGVSKETVLEMEQRLNAVDAAFDAPAREEESYKTPAGYLEDKRVTDPLLLLEKEDTIDDGKERLAEALTQLDPRSVDILNQRWLAESKATLHDLAAQYQVSAERIRQLEQNAMRKLKKLMLEAA